MDKLIFLEFLICFAIALYFTLIFIAKMIQIHAYILKDKKYALPTAWEIAFACFMWACTILAWMSK
jgi:hypothetical protein